VEDILREYEFRAHRSDCWSNEKDVSLILLELEVSQMPAINEKIGSYVWKENNAKNFIEKYQKIAINGPYIRDNTWRVEVERKWKSAQKKLKDTLSDKEKVLKAKGIPNHIALEFTEGFKIFEDEKIGELIKDRGIAVFLRKYFEKEKLSV
jgi:tRNA nucleotidyltransferase (CCA-adding enzyme)